MVKVGWEIVKADDAVRGNVGEVGVSFKTWRKWLVLRKGKIGKAVSNSVKVGVLPNNIVRLSEHDQD